MRDDRPQYLQALSAARSLTRITGEIVVTYYDETGDNPDEMLFCTESQWDVMVDNGIVESSWALGWMYPEDVMKQKRDGTLHDRLLSLGWKHDHSAPRYDYYSKKGWTVRVPINAAYDPVYSRRAK